MKITFCDLCIQQSHVIISTNNAEYCPTCYVKLTDPKNIKIFSYPNGFPIDITHMYASISSTNNQRQ